MPRILIADDHAVVRAGYKQLLTTEASITEIGEAASGQETLDCLWRNSWDVLLLDIHMPDRSGLDVLKAVSREYPEVRVLIMSGLPQEQYERNVLRAGASGYLSKGDSPQELLRAVRLLLNGQRYVSASLAESLVADLERPAGQRVPLHAALSTLEFEVFCKLSAGIPLVHIAAALDVSVKTVSSQRRRVLEKMKCTSNAEIMRYALRNGLISNKQILRPHQPRVSLFPP